MNRVIVKDYDSTWPDAFERIRLSVWPVVSDAALNIEHVGSTSVPGMAAKPIIDVDVVCRDNDNIRQVIEGLATLGYVHRGDLGIQGREAFTSPKGMPRHNLYVCLKDGVALLNHLAVRDHLRTHPETAREYSDLKKRLARQFPDDIDAYIEGKTAFLLQILQSAGLSSSQLDGIAAVNKKKVHRDREPHR